MKGKLRGFSRVAIASVLVIAALLVLVPSLAVGLGRLLGGLWVTVMGAVMGLIGSLFGA